MVFDHLPIVPGLVPEQAVGIIHFLTRCVGAWFAYTAVEGFLYTRNQLRYNGRLFVWAVIMQVGNLILNMLYRSAGVGIYNNIFMTLAFGILVLNLLFHETKSLNNATAKKKWVVAAVRIITAVLVMTAGIFLTEGGTIVIPIILATYLFRNNTKLRNLVYLIFGAVLFVLAFEWYPGDLKTTIDMLLINSDWAFPIVIPFLYLYNGQRGRSDKFAK